MSQHHSKDEIIYFNKFNYPNSKTIQTLSSNQSANIANYVCINKEKSIALYLVK